ncbi:MAG TPA: DMT family transporter [Desulfobacterales bacterium]|nr:DMT family transporter [Desulfobacterales bacterium]
MTAGSAVRLLILAAIWGGSFLFMRIGAPVLGPAWLIQFRVGIAALFLLICAGWFHKPLQLRKYWRHYLILGCFNSALPFFLIAFAAKTLTAALLSVLNSSSPIFGAIISAVWLRNRVTRLTAAGLAMGVIGVIILVQNGIATRTDEWGMAVAAALLSTICYGISGTYIKASPKPVEPFSNAHGSMWAATVLMALTLPFCPTAAEPSPGVWTAVAALGVLCTGVAYLIYFRLIQDMGPISALSVTFLIPVFGILWGVLFLDEQIDWSTIIGALIVLVGTALTNGITPRFFLESGKRARPDRPEKSQ